jgi:transmembrane sensor
MNKPDPKSPVYEQAAYWCLRLCDDDVEPDEIEAALAWQDESSAHREAFARVETFWRATEKLTWRTFPSIHVPSRVRASRRRWAWAAAVLLVAGTLSFLAQERSPVPSGPVLANSAGVVSPPVSPEQEAPARLGTSAGENRTVTLEDGSEVILGGASAIAVNYLPSERRIALLAGEALFRVAKNPDRPFLVDAGDGETQAVGTVFNVHRGPDSVTVTVVEGVVNVQPGPDQKGERSLQAARLVAGHQVSYSNKGVIGPIQKAPIERATSWKDGELTFIDRSLADVVADLNRYSERPIKIDDDALKPLRITGRVTVGKMDEWLRALEKNLPIRIVATTGSVTLSGTAAPASPR